MKLFVWEDVLRDYKAGMVVAVAPDLEGALQAIKTVDDTAYSCIRPLPSETIDLGDCPGVEPRAWIVWGGG